MLTLVYKCYAELIYMCAIWMHICFKSFIQSNLLLFFSVWSLYNFLFVFKPIWLYKLAYFRILSSRWWIVPYINLLLFLTLIFYLPFSLAISTDFSVFHFVPLYSWNQLVCFTSDASNGEVPCLVRLIWWV